MQRLLITGATGYLGQRVVTFAVQTADQIIASVHQQPCDHPAVENCSLDLSDSDAIQSVLNSVHPTKIIHIAAVTPAMGSAMTSEALWQINVVATAKIAQWCSAHQARLVHVSSDAIWGGREQPYENSDVPEPINSYGASKAAAEAVLAAVYPQALWVRTSLIYGCNPPDPNTIMAAELANGLREGSLFTDEYRCPIFVDDLAQALLELSNTTLCGPLNLAGPELLSRYELGKALLAWAGIANDSLPSGSAQAFGLRRPSCVAVSSQAAYDVLTTPIRTIATVLDQEAYRGNKPQSNR